MEVRARQEQGVFVLELVGRPRRRQEQTVIRDGAEAGIDAGHRRFVLDLHQLPVVDSAALGDLVAATVLIRHRGGRVKLAGLTPGVTGVLETTHLLGLAERYDDTSTAVRSFDLEPAVS